MSKRSKAEEQIAHVRARLAKAVRWLETERERNADEPPMTKEQIEAMSTDEMLDITLIGEAESV